MSNDWQPGDLALCVKGGAITATAAQYPQVGKVYEVAGSKMVTFDDDDYDLALLLNGAPINRRGVPEWWHGRFIKVTPAEADEFDREVIDLLRQKEKVA